MLQRNIQKKHSKGKTPVLVKIDQFGQPLPNFNIKGSDSVNSRLGGFCTLVLSVLVLAYAVVKFEQMWLRHNPIMSSYEKDVDPNEILNLRETNFRIAFSVEDYGKPQSLKNDPEFVRWHFRMKG